MTNSWLLVCRGPFVGGRDRAANQRDQRLPAAAVARAQVALTLDRRGRRQRTERRLQHRLALRVQGQPVLGHAHLVDERLRQRHVPLRGILLTLQLPVEAVLRQQLRTQACDTPSAPPPPRSGPAPPSAVGGLLDQQRQQLVGLGKHHSGTTHRQHPGQHGILDRRPPRNGERLGHRHDLRSPTRAGARRMAPHPLHRRECRCAAPDLAPAHRLGKDGHPSSLAGGDHAVGLGHDHRQLGRPRPPQLSRRAHPRPHTPPPSGVGAPRAPVPLPSLNRTHVHRQASRAVHRQRRRPTRRDARRRAVGGAPTPRRPHRLTRRAVETCGFSTPGLG